jgi:glycosyltransferase involved in cell wall biosynthesis
MQVDTALREYVRQRILEIGPSDILVGIPTYNNEETIANVMKVVFEGLQKHYPGMKSVLMVSDGGSLDYTREIAQSTKPGGRNIQKIVAIYRGLPGKGTSLRAIFEAAVRLRVKVCAVFDSDLRSISPHWLKAMIDPVTTGGYDFVSPYYVRHKYDGTITNNIAYALTRALYGKRVRQPIGGDFGFSPKLVEFFTREHVWDTDVARFGIDIWMTTVAINEGFRICESYLGAKVHDAKDPAASLGPMFRQVVGTLFGMMKRYEKCWRRVQGSETVPLLGEKRDVEPPPIEVTLEKLIGNYKSGFEHFAPLWKEIVREESFKVLVDMNGANEKDFHFPMDAWARLVYDFAYTFNKWEKDKYKLVELMTPLYYARVASFVIETRDMSLEDAERKVEEAAEAFERLKPYLIERMGQWESASLEGV